MKSLYLAIVLAMVVILALSVVVFLAITKSMEDSYFNPIFDDMDEVSVQEAAEMLQTTGPEAVTTYMHRLDSVFGGVHYLVDADGNDVVSGQSHVELLPQAPLTQFRGEKDGRQIIAHRSSDGRYWFVVMSPLRPKTPPLYRFYLLVAGASILLCWLAAVFVVSPRCCASWAKLCTRKLHKLVRRHARVVHTAVVRLGDECVRLSFERRGTVLCVDLPVSVRTSVANCCHLRAGCCRTVCMGWRKTSGKVRVV